MKRLDIDSVMALHQMICDRTGGNPALRDRGLLESALESPFAGFGGVEIYSSIQQKAARLGFSLISNHAFVDGNKRIGILALMVFLQLNGIAGNLTDGDVVFAAMGVADGSIDYDGLLGWVCEHYSEADENA